MRFKNIQAKAKAVARVSIEILYYASAVFCILMLLIEIFN